MSRAAPGFWWEPPGWQARLLSPLALLYGGIAARRLERAPRVPVEAPVLCVGNFTVGGTGKTPIAIALAQAARERGLRPGVLSRGHGGAGRVRAVEPGRDRADEVGDEPLLLAAHAPVAVGADRLAAARLLLDKGCDILVMDDGFQSARLRIDLALLVVDRRFGLGNGRCLPAGPLRAPLSAQLAHADALLLMGEGDRAAPVRAQAESRGLPVHAARLAATNPQAVKGRRVLAFAGIGHPQKFFRSLEEAGASIRRARSFPDHHAFTAADIAALSREAKGEELDLATTAKDAVRLRAVAPGDFLKSLLVLDVEARFLEPDTPYRLIARAQDAWRRRRA